MKFLLTVLLGLVLLTVESVVVKYLGLSVSRIDVTVAIIAFLALRAGTLEGAFSSFCLGYLLDLMSGRPTGLYTFLAVLVFLLGRLAAQLVNLRSALGFALFAMAADLAHGLLAIFFQWLATGASEAVASNLGAIPLQVGLTGLAAALLYPLLQRLDSGSDRPQMGLLR